MIRLIAGWLGLGLGLAATTCGLGDRPGQGPDRDRLLRELDRGNPGAIERALAGREGDSTSAYLLGRAALERGRLARAESLFARAPGADRSLGAAYRALSYDRRGERRWARATAESLATRLETRTDQPAADWLALGIAYRILGADQPAQTKDALAAFDRAAAADPTSVEIPIHTGELFLDRYNAPDAKEAFALALKRDAGNPRALLGLARVALFEGSSETGRLIEQVTKAAPDLALARAVRARLDLDAEQFDSAFTHASRAIELDSSGLLPWATRAAAQLLQGDSAGFAGTERLVRSRHRAPAGFFAEVAEALGRQRRYRAAAAVAARGVATDSTDPAALTALGVNQLRLGAIDSGRAHLERAFARDPYHLWNKNILDLLDQLARYRTVAAGRSVFVAEPDEIDLLTLYLAPLLERAYDSLATRYHYRPPTPIRVELYQRHADFSVRTVGVAGLGALGVSFGSVLAMDAPSARPVGEINWGSTAWHELTHAFTLGVTEHRVPRWLSEGLSVLEERRARPGWGANATVAFVSALKGGQLHPVARLNDGFVRPRHPADVSFAYYQASLFCEYLETTFGFEALNRLLAGYREGRRTDAALRAATGVAPDELSSRFDGWLLARFREPLARVAAFRDSTVTPGELELLLETGRKLEAEGKMDDALTVYQKADQMFPEMADHESPAWRLSKLYRSRGDTAAALRYLRRVTRLDEGQFEANRLEAELAAGTKDFSGAVAAYERANFISPFDPALHAAAAEAAARAADHPRAVRERRAVVTLKPSDPAGAFYQLAVAYRDAGDRAAARREVLKALEIAPAFEPAQALLLDLRRAAP